MALEGLLTFSKIYIPGNAIIIRMQQKAYISRLCTRTSIDLSQIAEKK